MPEFTHPAYGVTTGGIINPSLIESMITIGAVGTWTVNDFPEYKNADIVSEHFGKGSIGMGAMDAMAVGRPVIANGSPEIFTRALGETPPICHATTAEEVRCQLVRLAADRDWREAIGKQSRSYVEKYCTPEHAARMVLGKLENAK